MKKIQFKYVRYLDSSIIAEEYFKQISKKELAKLLRTIENIEELGLREGIKNKWVKKIGSDLYEIRSHVGSNQQRVLYFHKHDNIFLITHGFTKKSQKTPKREIERAKRIREEFWKGNLR